MTLQQAMDYGKRIGVMYYIKNEHDCVIGGSTTLSHAREMLLDLQQKGFGELHIETVDGEVVT